MNLTKEEKEQKIKELIEQLNENNPIPISNNSDKKERVTMTSLIASLTCIILLACISLCAIKFTITYTNWF